MSLIEFTLYSVNFIVLFQTVAKILQNLLQGYFNLGHHVHRQLTFKLYFLTVLYIMNVYKLPIKLKNNEITTATSAHIKCLVI